MKLQDRINKVLESRVFLIIFSIFVAVAFWIYVEHTLNEDIESRGIRAEIQYLHPELVTDRRLVITDYETQEVTLRFTGKKNVIDKLYEQGAVRVTADLSNVVSAGLNSVEYRVTYADGIDARDVTISSRSTQTNYVSIHVEKAFDKQVPVVAEYTGLSVAAEGYQAEQPIFVPESVTVYGPQSVVESVAAVRVEVRRENLSKTVTEELAFVAIDADKNVIESDMLTFDRDAISVTVPIRMIKDVVLTINPIYGAGATAENTVVTITPEKLTLTGEGELLSSLNSLTLATIDMTKFESFYTVTLPIVIPNDMVNLTGVNEADVTITITGLETRRVTVPYTSLQVTNESAGYTADLITASIEVLLRGTTAQLDAITTNNVRIVADLADYGETAGTFTVPAKVYLDGQFGDCGAVGDYKIAVRVTKDSGINVYGNGAVTNRVVSPAS